MSKLTNAHQLTIEELQSQYPNQDFEQGLSSATAQKRLTENGPNRLASKRPSKWWLFLRQFNNLIIYILILAALLTLLMGHYSDAIIIGLVVIINAVIGYYQEANASNALERIKQLLATEATVYRDGQRIDVPTDDLVVGDVVFLEAGDSIPADLRIVSAENLRIQESTLTGEADSVIKSCAPLASQAIPLAEQTNMAFASTSVTNGSGLGIVVATAEQTEIGQISTAVNATKPPMTPLMREINGVGAGVSYVVIGAAILLFILGFFLETYSISVLAVAIVAMVVGSIPEGLPATTSVILAMGVSEMAKKHRTIVKTLPAVETLGAVDVIATDKTGTLTKNEMTIKEIITPEATYQLTGNGYAPTGELLQAGQPAGIDHTLELFLEAGFEANDTTLVHEPQGWLINGEPTDGAFLTAYYKAYGAQMTPANQEIDMLPFDSDYRYMAKLVALPSGQKRIYIKGSPDKLLPMAAQLDSQFALDNWLNQVQQLSEQGKRVIAVGYLDVTDDVDQITHERLRQGIQLLGLAGIIDPPRDEVIEALKAMNRAGIDVKMITGDHPSTAKAIGEQLGLAQTIKAITGAQWEQLSAEAKQQAAIEHQVFARTTPKNKLEIVQALQARQKVTAMTGDGVNDAPALKQADIGVAMGIKGTDVAKDSADMILTDDNFATMSRAIFEGRRIYDNIKKSILFLLPTSFAEGLIVAFTILMQQPMPLQATQLLWINMVSAITIQFAFIFEPAEAGIMYRKPRKTGQSLMNKHDIFQMGYVSILMAAFGLIAYQWLLNHGVDQVTASTMMVNMIIISKIGYLFNIRTKELAFSKAFFTNPKAFAIIGLMLGLQLILTYVPFMQKVFYTEPLTLLEWGIAIGAGLLILVLTELDKIIRLMYHQKRYTLKQSK